MKLHSPELTEQIEKFYTQTLALLRKVEEIFDQTKEKIIKAWEEALKPTHNLPALSTMLIYLHDSTGLVKKIYNNDRTDVADIPRRHTSLTALQGVDIGKLIEIAQPYVPQVEAAIKQAQDDLRKHEVDKLLEDIRKKMGRPI